MVQRQKILFWLFLLVTDGLGLTRATGNRCGYLPNEIYLKRGERKSIVFWTDQNYENTEPAEVDLGNNPNGEGSVDVFLQAVNGGVQLKPETQDEDDGPTFITPSTTTTSTTTAETVTTEQETTATATEAATEANFDQPDTTISNDETTIQVETTQAVITEEQDDQAITDNEAGDSSAAEQTLFVSPVSMDSLQEKENVTVVIGETQPIDTSFAQPQQENLDDSVQATTTENIEEATTLASVANDEDTKGSNFVAAEAASHVDSILPVSVDTELEESVQTTTEPEAYVATTTVQQEEPIDIEATTATLTIEKEDDQEEVTTSRFIIDLKNEGEAETTTNAFIIDLKNEQEQVETTTAFIIGLKNDEELTQTTSAFIVDLENEGEISEATTTTFIIDLKNEDENSTIEPIKVTDDLESNTSHEEATFTYSETDDVTTEKSMLDEEVAETTTQAGDEEDEAAIKNASKVEATTATRYSHDEETTTESIVDVRNAESQDFGDSTTVNAEHYQLDESETTTVVQVVGLKQFEGESTTEVNVDESAEAYGGLAIEVTTEENSVDEESSTLVDKLVPDTYDFDGTTIAYPDDEPKKPSLEAALAEVQTQELVVPHNASNNIIEETTIAFPLEGNTVNPFDYDSVDTNRVINKVSVVNEALRKSARYQVDYAHDKNNGLHADSKVKEKPTNKNDKMEANTHTTTRTTDTETMSSTIPLNTSNLNKKENVTVLETIASANSTDDEGVPFPVSDLLNGIVKLVSDYIKPKPVTTSTSTTTTTNKPILVKQTDAANTLKLDEAEGDIDEESDEEIPAVPKPTIIGPQPLNAHTIPRDQLIVEAVDEELSDSDPFFQMAAPNLRENVPLDHVKDAEKSTEEILFPKPVHTEPARTLSPFNSPALIVQEPPKIDVKKSIGAAAPLPLDAPIERSGYPALSDDSESDNEHQPLHFLPGGFLRGGPADQQQQPRPPTSASQPPKSIGPSTKPGLPLIRNAQASRDPVFIPIPQRVVRRTEDPVDTIRSAGRRFMGFLDSLPLPMKNSFFRRAKRDVESDDVTDASQATTPETPETTGSAAINCNWDIKTENGLYLLATFHNLSAPYSVDCEGAYIEVERENNGFEARWCGNRVTKGGSRPHVIFAKNEIRITVFDDGNQEKELPTGFSADIEVIDLFDGQQYSNLRKTNAYSSVRKLVG